MIRQIEVDTDKIEIGIEEWKHKFKFWRESNCTSPSGVHLGHFKALTETIYVIDDTQFVPDLEITNMQQEIFDLHLSLINVILKSGHSISRLQKCNNISIPKISDCILVDKLGNIHVYDLNAVLAIKWKAAIFKAEESNQISESQLGSRRGNTAQTPISRLTRRSYGQINYDAKACYDRNLPNLASIDSDAFGVPKSIVKLHNYLLHNTKYSVVVPGSQKE
jgi:hypothetical protein